MPDSFSSELVHFTCGECKKVASLSLASVEANNQVRCPYCGSPISVDLRAAEADASRQAHELDESVDSLGSAE